MGSSLASTEAACGAGFRAPSKTLWCDGRCVMGRCLPATTEPRFCAKARHAMWLDEARRENDAVHHRSTHHGAWVALAVIVEAHIGIEICLSCGAPVRSNHPDRTTLRGSSVTPAEELLVREHHARQVQGLGVPFATAHRRAAARHGKSSVLSSGFPWRSSAAPTTALSATCPVSCANGARSESAAASRSRLFRSRPEPHSFAAASADGTGLAHHDAAA